MTQRYFVTDNINYKCELQDYSNLQLPSNLLNEIFLVTMVKFSL